MKNSNIKKILSLVLFAALALTVVFALSSCGEHVHEFETETVAATCTEDGYVKTFCKCGAKEIKVERSNGHNFVVESEVKATCTVDGKVVQTCSACGETETTVTKASGHNIVKHDAVKVSCTVDGNEAYETCKNCDYTTYEKIAATGHKAAAAVQENVKPFTCTENGSFDEVVYCETCSAELERKTETVLAPGHVWVSVEEKAATCVIGWYAHEACQNCDEKKDYVEIAPKYDHIRSEHPVEIKDTRVNPTCTDDGYYYEAVMCTHDCGYAFTEPTKRVLTKLGHDVVEHAAQAPDCVNKGWEAYETCARCDAYTTYVELPALGHTPLAAVEENRTQPDCVNKGGYDMATYCEVCSAEVSRVHHDVAALGHDYVNHEAKPNSCTEIGWNAYRTCNVCDYTEYVEIPAHGHNEVEGEIENFIEPTCSTLGSYDRVFFCSICEVELRRESWDVPAVAHNTLGVVDAKAPTCTEGGWNAYTCCSKCGYSDNKVELPALGHKITQHAAKAPTCTEIGWDAYEDCSECDYTTYVEKGALGHDIVSLGASAPDCENNGLTAGQYCTRCDDQTVKQEIIPAYGHDFDANGVCGNCGHKVSLGLSYTTVAGGYAFTGVGNCKDKNVVIPSEVNGVPVVAVADNAFKYSDVESVVIPASVKVVGRDAFFACSSLKSVVIEGATAIDDYAFFGCGKLTTVTICGSVKSIGANAFGSCHKLATVYYEGTADEWALITIGSGNEKLTSATRKYI